MAVRIVSKGGSVTTVAVPNTGRKGATKVIFLIRSVLPSPTLITTLRPVLWLFTTINFTNICLLGVLRNPILTLGVTAIQLISNWGRVRVFGGPRVNHLLHLIENGVVAVIILTVKLFLGFGYVLKGWVVIYGGTHYTLNFIRPSTENWDQQYNDKPASIIKVTE